MNDSLLSSLTKGRGFHLKLFKKLNDRVGAAHLTEVPTVVKLQNRFFRAP